MNITRRILFKSFVKPFYRQHAGLFVFLFVILFGAVGVVDGAGIFEYHYSLIRGLMNNPFLFFLVLFLWTLYAKKTEKFIVGTIGSPEFSFLQALLLLDRPFLFRSLLRVQFFLLLPIIFYAALICSAAVYLHMYISGFLVLIYLLTLSLVSVYWYMFVLENPDRNAGMKKNLFSLKTLETPYWCIFIRYAVRSKKLLLTGIKIYSCAVLYYMVKNQAGTATDLSMILLFYSMGMLGHGILIHQMRKFEETRLAFFRTVPVPLTKRFLQYGILYFILLIPEFITIIALTPKYLSFNNGFLIAFFSYSILLFLNSLLFIQYFKMKDYLKIILCLYFLIYLSVLSNAVPLFSIFLLISALMIFFIRYYRFER
jgi:hypothetical protein